MSIEIFGTPFKFRGIKNLLIVLIPALLMCYCGEDKTSEDSSQSEVQNIQGTQSVQEAQNTQVTCATPMFCNQTRPEAPAGNEPSSISRIRANDTYTVREVPMLGPNNQPTGQSNYTSFSTPHPGTNQPAQLQTWTGPSQGQY